MLTLLSECHLWTIRDEIRIRQTDLGAFRYTRSRDFDARDICAVAKRDYAERRNGTVVLKNHKKTHTRLKDNMKRLEEILKTQKIVYSQWKDATIVLILLSSGLIVHLCIDIYTGDILRMAFEKYLVGKLAADVITDAVFSRSHIVLAYNTNQVTVVCLQKPNMRAQGPEKIANMDPKMFHVLIPGPSERRLARNLSVNASSDLFVIWTKSSQNEVYPWRPTIRDQDRANIHVFKLKGSQLESVSYCWSENDPLCVDFLRSSESQILTVEQKVSRKGEISAEICSYELNSGKMQRTAVTSIPMGTQICCYAFSPDQEKLFLGTIDRNVCLHDLVRQISKFINQIDIIPTQCTWHADSSVIMVANDRSQFQCFDLALTTIANQLQSEDVTPSNLLDLSHYFRMQPTLLNIAFSRKPDLSNFTHAYAQTDCFLLLIFENGPIGCLRFFSLAGMRGDIHNSGLTADVIIDKYLTLNQLEKAVNLLLAVNWETYGAMCLISLHKIASHVFFRSDARRSRAIELMSKALKTYSDALSEDTKDEFSDQVFDLKRRFFFFLLRNNHLAEAFEVAQDVEDYDLFMDLFNVTKTNTNLVEFSSAAYSQAAGILNETENGGDCNSETSGSQSSCSDTNQNQTNSSSRQAAFSVTSSSNHRTEGQLRHEKALNVLKNYVPPLPSFKSKVFSAENIKINIPKPELRIESTNTSGQRGTLPTPPLPDMRYLNLSAAPQDSLHSLRANSSSTIPNLQRLRTMTNGQQLDYNIPWQQVPDQTLGIPTILNAPSNPYMPSTAHNILPRASAIMASTPFTSSNINLNNNAHLSFVHYASPVAVTEVSASPSVRTCYPTIATHHPKFYQHPLVSGTIPPSTVITPNDDLTKRQPKKPAISILSNSGSSTALNHNGGGFNNASATHHTINNGNAVKDSATLQTKRESGEKNKVKFCDTVQVAVVPEIPRKEKPQPPKRNGYARPPRNLTNPKKELADSLPLCHPNDDYLKDFNPISEETLRGTKLPTNHATREEHSSLATSHSQQTKSASSIKVVHFGVV